MLHKIYWSSEQLLQEVICYVLLHRTNLIAFHCDQIESFPEDSLANSISLKGNILPGTNPIRDLSISRGVGVVNDHLQLVKHYYPGWSGQIINKFSINLSNVCGVI